MNGKRINGGDRSAFFASFRPLKSRLGPMLAVAGSFLVIIIIAIGSAGAKKKVLNSYDDFEPGKVAERDIVAERSVSFIDEAATLLRREALEARVPAVFVFSSEVRDEAVAHFSDFKDTVLELLANGTTLVEFLRTLQTEFVGFFDIETLSVLYRSSGKARSLEGLRSILEKIYDEGIWSLPIDVSDLQTGYVELLRSTEGDTTRVEYAQSQVVTLAKVSSRLDVHIANGEYPSVLKTIAPALLKPFITENIFYSPDETRKRRELIGEQTEPVLKHLEQGERIIRKGFVITTEDYERLKAVGSAEIDDGLSQGIYVFFLLVFLLMTVIFLTSKKIIGRTLSSAEIYVLSISAMLYVFLASLADMFLTSTSPLIAVYLPTALLSVVCSVLMGPKVAVAFVLALPLAAFAASSFDATSFFFAYISGTLGAFALKGVEKRMDLIKAGALIALTQIVLAAVLLFGQAAPITAYPSVFFWAAFNGVVSSTLVLGLLPLLEQALNAATSFRLIELSDLNSPMLKRLLTVAPGTYSHSVMVANLAESACREIGADALLARVGAYFHDIGKIDQPEYFIENQASYNKHEDLAPRLSATVIRSHVKLGIEKARSLHLPKEVVEIIAEHHGNSVISWFYNEALKREDQVKPDDFAYPGKPPRSRESAVVMLADSVEAAMRTMKKPTMTKMDKFIQEIIMGKFDQGQLVESELTFKDLESIKNAFVRVLAGYYHNRIEYPKNKEFTA